MGIWVIRRDMMIDGPDDDDRDVHEPDPDEAYNRVIEEGGGIDDAQDAWEDANDEAQRRHGQGGWPDSGRLGR
jgi:hypothetical protein